MQDPAGQLVVLPAGVQAIALVVLAKVFVGHAVHSPYNASPNVFIVGFEQVGPVPTLPPV